MAKYATFNEAGHLVGRYDSAIHGDNVPANAIRLSDELFYQTISDGGGIWALLDGEVVQVPPLEASPDYPALIANERYRREASGITVDGLAIETTRDSQALIAGTGLSAILDPEYRCNFKTANGFVEIVAPQIITIAMAVRKHVQACFDRELILLRTVESGTYTNEMLDEGWPDSSLPTTNTAAQ
ncbi:DUF4376 domain-containing protein [Pseudomonas sp. B21-015]|uniref:DUF4376 domain-containing protein n=1 Tax=Pseudomonas sp. B21-015 TaxID=2895473 RepID=UPI00215F9F8D|nr:DUF4376 domain-containing protein [Pseudomonas sp. B21-015]UVM49362.1 DUF4376 domain-containing protein [Pseudomonas sp. B21-015]